MQPTEILHQSVRHAEYPAYFEEKLIHISPQEYIESEDIKYQPFYLECNSQNEALWSGIIYAYKGLMLAFGAFLAWETRTVNVPALNDSRYIGISVYNVVVSCTMGMAIVNTIEFDPDVQYAVVSLLIVFCTTITLCLVFIPKVSPLRTNS